LRYVINGTDRFNGKGLVMTTGLRAYFTGAYVILRVIREVHKSVLPIEIYYAGKEELEDHAARFLEAKFSHLRVINIYDVQDVPKDVPMTGYQLKVYATMMSSFQEVMWLDSDNVPMVDPATVFNLKAYKTTGGMMT
jgi:hypothetical protein